MQKQGNDNQRNENSVRVARFYVILIVISVIIMIIAAYITYGHDGYVGHIFFERTEIEEKKESNKNKLRNELSIGADLSLVPSDKMIEDILNDTIPNVCKYDDATDEIKKKCKKKPLSCLKSYEINKILVKNTQYQDQLFIELLTGKKVQKKYTVVIDLINNNQVLSKEGEIDKKRCRKLEEGEDEIHYIGDDPSIMKDGNDSASSHYVEIKENI